MSGHTRWTREMEVGMYLNEEQRREGGGEARGCIIEWADKKKGEKGRKGLLQKVPAVRKGIHTYVSRYVDTSMYTGDALLLNYIFNPPSLYQRHH